MRKDIKTAGKNTRFQKGNKAASGKRGRKHLKTILRELVEIQLSRKSPLTNKIEKKTISEHIACSMVSLAIKGNYRMMKEFFDRYYGVIDKNINIAGKMEMPKLSITDFQKCYDDYEKEKNK